MSTPKLSLIFDPINRYISLSLTDTGLDIEKDRYDA